MTTLAAREPPQQIVPRVPEPVRRDALDARPFARAPAALSPAHRASVVAALPGEVTYDEMAMPEGIATPRPRPRARCPAGLLLAAAAPELCYPELPVYD